MANVPLQRTFIPFYHPSAYRRIDKVAFSKLHKAKVNEGKPICPGHLGTEIWLVTNEKQQHYFVTQVKMESQDDVFILTPCRYEPTFGIDFEDGQRMEDAEYLILHEKLDYTTDRLAIFGIKEMVDPIVYLKQRGFPLFKNVVIKPAKKWWQFWK